MIKQTIKRVGIRATHAGRKAVSLLKPYEPMGQGRELLDAQYAAAEWDYLRSISEAPRFGVVSAYCRQLATNGAILEIGCGEGFLLEQLDRSRYGQFTGVDISSVAIERARGLADARTTFVSSDAESYVPDRTYDVIVFNEVLEYFDDPFALVQRYEPYLSPSGHFVVSMFDPPVTVRTRKIWKTLGRRYGEVAHTRVRTHRDFVWNIRVLRVPDAS
jgi:2-polyprenyl-3-methyl-5-hydroxy-6-metoxy-1,4-benzoquinol methylase